MPAAANPAVANTSATRSTLQCFRAGTHLALSGAQLAFAGADLEATARAYDPALHEAPLVVGHPALDAPAYGWVSGLACAAGALEATPHQVNAEFAAMVNGGAFKKMSAAFWAPDAPGNPAPGVYYLRHIGFLGAAAPGVPGLRTPTFAGTADGIVEFSAWTSGDNASLWRALRDWCIGKFGQADADTALPPYLVASVERGASEAIAAAPQTVAPMFAQPLKDQTVTEAEKLALEADNARLRQQLADAATANRTTRLASATSEAVAFADGLVSQGRLAAGHRDVVVATFTAVAAQAEAEGAAVHFGQGDARAPLLPALRTMLAALPLLAPAGRQATAARAADGGGAHAVAFAAPAGTEVQQDRLALMAQAQAYQRANPGASFIAACRAVGA